jgi:predicted metal-binding membrane protein
MNRPPPPPSPRALPRRDRFAVVAALAGVTALAWAYLYGLARQMDAMPDAATMLQMHSWSGLDFALTFAMWAVMMVGMMVPSAAPMTLIYAAVARKAARQGTPLAPTVVFVSGYVAMWCAFSLGATCAQWALDRAALLSPLMAARSPGLGAGLLIAAGLYQLTSFKEACLRHCRAPAHFIAERWRPGTGGAFRMGLEHGGYCLGCCWVLMGLLFVGGVMNLLWIAAITVFVLLEKLLPAGVGGGRLAGAAMVAGGVALLALARSGGA